MPFELRFDDPLAVALVGAIRAGSRDLLDQLLAQNAGLATARMAAPNGAVRTPLHIVADWPGYFPNGPGTVAALIVAGGNPNAAVTGSSHAETPLHWAASSDDIDVAEALLAGGADIEAVGGSVAGGTPLDNAVGFGCWRVARLLVGRGARVEILWHAAALGLLRRVEEFFASPTPPSPAEINHAFWQACHGGQRRVAEYLHARGADVHWVPEYAKQDAHETAGSPDTGRQALQAWLRDLGSGPAPSPR